MKTSSYNPSPLEVDFANALYILQKENPQVRFHLLDKDGDPHEVVVRIIQIPDKF
jgi:hypothetical protein